MTSILASSSSNGPQPIRVPAEARSVTQEAPAPSPMQEKGEPLWVPSTAPAAMDGASCVLKAVHERSIVRHELFREAMGAMNQLGGELTDVDARLKAEGLRLVEEWHKLKVAINLGSHQRELDNVKARCLSRPRVKLAPALWKKLGKLIDVARSQRSARGSSKPGVLPWSSK